MAKRSPNYVCQNCGTVYQRWQGKCDACGEWNSIAEEDLGRRGACPPRSARGAAAGFSPSNP